MPPKKQMRLNFSPSKTAADPNADLKVQSSQKKLDSFFGVKSTANSKSTAASSKRNQAKPKEERKRSREEKENIVDESPKKRQKIKKETSKVSHPDTKEGVTGPFVLGKKTKRKKLLAESDEETEEAEGDVKMEVNNTKHDEELKNGEKTEIEKEVNDTEKEEENTTREVEQEEEQQSNIKDGEVVLMEVDEDEGASKEETKERSEEMEQKSSEKENGEHKNEEEENPKPKDETEKQIATFAEEENESSSDVENSDKNPEKKTEKKGQKKKIGLSTLSLTAKNIPPSFDPVASACWKKGEKVPYLHLSRVFEKIEAESGRLKTTEMFTQALRSVIALNQEELLPCIYLSISKIAPPNEGLELGVGDNLLYKCIAETCGKSVEYVKKAAEEEGDLGVVALESRRTQRTVYKPQPLTIEKVFKTFREIATETGKDSMNKKKDKIKQLLVACREAEAKYITRSLQGKLRIGLQEPSVIVGLSHACVLTPPSKEFPPPVLDARAHTSTEKLEQKLADAALKLKAIYSELPSWDLIVPNILQFSIEDLQSHCHITPGIPLKPMLAKPTKGIGEVFERFENNEFTCEFKYDGERAQIHVTTDGNVFIYSRNSENNTGKYPDLIELVKSSLKPEVKECIFDAEVVAYDREQNKILPFQVLSTRARKDVALSEIKVHVCLFVFDILFKNGVSYLREPLKKRREELYASVNEKEGGVMFASHMESTETDSIQTFLNEAVQGYCEGLMIKTLVQDATYEPSQRSMKWLKLKKDYLKGMGDSLDLVPIGAYYGKGKRTGTFGAYLLACYNEEDEEYQTICKIGTGFSDEFLSESTEFFKKHLVDAPKSYYRYSDSPNLLPDVWFDTVQVWEVLAADLSVSPNHRAAVGEVDPTKGIALRFPRFLRIREDKEVEQATTANQVVEMYRKQSTTVKESAEDEFY